MDRLDLPACGGSLARPKIFHSRPFLCALATARLGWVRCYVAECSALKWEPLSTPPCAAAARHQATVWLQRGALVKGPPIERHQAPDPRSSRVMWTWRRRAREHFPRSSLADCGGRTTPKTGRLISQGGSAAGGQRTASRLSDRACRGESGGAEWIPGRRACPRWPTSAFVPIPPFVILCFENCPRRVRLWP